MAGIVLAAGLAISGAGHAAEDAGWRAAVEAFADQHFSHPAWGAAHSRRDYALARELAAQDKVAVDDDVLFAAAFLHDIAAFAPWENPDPKVDHSDVGADALGPVLVKLGFPAGKIEAVRAATRTHMYYRKAETPEAIYLHDADALDWLGAIGVARMLATIDPPAPVQDLKKAVAAIEANLADAPSGVQSPAGRARLPGMVAEARDFLARLKAESADGDAL
ncbi:HD domain-containing protein [Novosphingobium cyanobacteriorum]|uniref:HD domain-containing protein n=1 Tax=Novosphingobium cyanobacteriorum TaxID=3024215 RepID=A0ABT6CQG7_9SPHN|nr:HD domain-containing protein [Novosphingobium cyanobacteriorum]MDF8334637.1 HD domain-containing protein [Novosphingobium cyanobacteriorum]